MKAAMEADDNHPGCQRTGLMRKFHPEKTTKVRKVVVEMGAPFLGTDRKLSR
jgi:hypothetical protein